MTLLALLPLIGSLLAEPSPSYCYEALVTGYVRTDHSSRTFDGTDISTSEAIAAAGWDIPIDSIVSVAGVGTFRVADRGRLAPGQIDVAVWDRPTAYSITGWRDVCVTPP
jgi:3D (Asp-Asp-Asp) domain-containing protein